MQTAFSMEPPLPPEKDVGMSRERWRLPSFLKGTRGPNKTGAWFQAEALENASLQVRWCAESPAVDPVLNLSSLQPDLLETCSKFLSAAPPKNEQARLQCCEPRVPTLWTQRARGEKTQRKVWKDQQQCWGGTTLSGNNTESWCDVPGSPVITNPPADAGDTGSIPGHGRSHKPGNN